jgi:hypothetical protein
LPEDPGIHGIPIFGWQSPEPQRILVPGNVNFWEALLSSEDHLLERMYVMSARIPVSLGCMVLFSLPVFVGAAGDDAKPITVELKSFTFKEEKADLFGYNEGEEKLFLYTNGKALAKFKVPEDGDYQLTIKANGDEALKEGAKFKVALDGKMVGKETETTSEPKEYTFDTTLKAGEHDLAIEFTNDVFKEGEYDRNLYVQGVKVKKAKK